ncbi:MAG TPA: hypothetical protein VM536_02515 [Chloroflexia bacterium]|nr:hypothetical protein [Chloroflexia bacterium]
MSLAPGATTLVPVTVDLEPEVAALLAHLAGGADKQGAFLASLIRAAAENGALPEVSDFESLRLHVAGMVSEIRRLDARLATLEGAAE